MEKSEHKNALNALSRLVIGATLVLSVGVAICAAPSNVAANAAALQPPALQVYVPIKTLSDQPGIALKRAYGAEDEDCVEVRGRIVCAR